MNHLRWVFLIGVVFIAACAGMGRQPSGTVSEVSPPEADRMLRVIAQKNAEMTAYKGIGRIGIQRGSNSWSVRTAWVAAPDGRLRVAALSLTGQAFARVICNPHQCFFVFRDGNCLRKESGGDLSLEPLLGMELGAGELACLLGGGVPLVAYDSATAYNMDSGEKLLALEKRFFGTVETVRFSADLAHVREVTVYGWGGPDYRAQITYRGPVEGRIMPFGLHVSNERGNRMRISVERCWPGITPSEHVFSADLPEGTRCD